jgi:hypothetical protein
MAPDALIPRVGMCLKLKGVTGADAAIVSVVQSADAARDRARLAAAGVMAGKVSRDAWAGYRYAIDIDGNTNAWRNLFTRLLMGNCVIKVASAGGYRQWYYERLVPFVHFVPVRADLSDLVETVEWCRSRPATCYEIARAGRSLALAMTFESETRAATERIRALVARGGYDAASLFS